MAAVRDAWEASFGGGEMKLIITFSTFGFAGLVGLYVILSLAGVEGWLVFGALVWALVGLGGLFVLAREGVEHKKGYDRWRNVVHYAQGLVNHGRDAAEVRVLVGLLNDPVLLETWDSLQLLRERDLERRQNGGEHSER